MSNTASEPELLSEISDKLNVIIGMLAIRGLEDDQGASVEKLHGLGLRPRVIGPIVGLSENAVNVRLTRSRKKKRSTKKS